ncbi:MAG: hypothetical protein AAF593_00350 [Planctomycetota bacterium]
MNLNSRLRRLEDDARKNAGTGRLVVYFDDDPYPETEPGDLVVHVVEEAEPPHREKHQ